MEAARQYLGKTLIEGWWGTTSFFVNLKAVAVDIAAMKAARELPPAEGEQSRAGIPDRASPIDMLKVVPRNAASTGGRIFPDIDAMGDPVFAADQHIIWHDSIRIALLRQRANDRPLAVIWESPVPASVWLTDRRLVFSCKKFTSGDWKVAWLDWGELLVSTVNSVSAEIHRFGKMAVGQIRHEWPISIFLKRLKPRIGRQLTLVGVTCIDPWDAAAEPWQQVRNGRD